jgi:SAM-dependent methyltransferase
MKTEYRPVPIILLLCSLLLVFSAAAQEQSIRPGINRHFEDPDWQQWVNTFERPGREVYDQRHAIIVASKVRPGMAVADVGAGTGLFTRLFAAAVEPNGTVYAIDLSRTFIDNILRTCREQGDGRVIIIDFRRDPRISSNWIMGHVRGNKTEVIQEMEAAGFRLVDDKQMMRSNYFLEFVKSGTETGSRD